MAKAFYKTHKGFSCELEPAEKILLRTALKDTQTLLETDQNLEKEDPLAALVGISNQTSTPNDPALARLLPAGNHEDPIEAYEYRRLTERTIRELKISNIKTVLFNLEGQNLVEVTQHNVEAWMAALNDVRLVLGSRLNIQNDADAKKIYDETIENKNNTTREATTLSYSFLTWLQESLVQLVLQHNFEQ